MSDLLDAAAAALGMPAALVERSAAARAAETGSSVDDILTAWAGGAPVSSTPAPAPAETSPSPAETVVEPAAEEPPAAPVAVIEAPAMPAAAVEAVPEPEPEEPLEPASIGQRLRVSVRIGAWTGAALGIVAFFFSSAFWADTAAVPLEGGPIVQVDSLGVMIGMALVSVVFGAIVAGLSRAGAAWSNPAMQLTNSKASTAWLGALLGLALGVIAGAALTAFGETPDPEGLTQMPVLTTFAVMLVGGAVLGAATAAIPQLLGTPVAVDTADEEEVQAVRGRLGAALSIPIVAVLLLVLLVIPFGWTLIQSNHLSPGGASIVGILTAGGILGFSALAGSKPEMKISFGDVLWAIIGLGSVLAIVIAVLLYVGADDHSADEGSAEENASAIVQLL